MRIFSFLAVVLSMQFGTSRSIMTNDSEHIKRGGFGPGDFIRRLKDKYYFPVCLFLLLLSVVDILFNIRVEEALKMR